MQFVSCIFITAFFLSLKIRFMHRIYCVDDLAVDVKQNQLTYILIIFKSRSCMMNKKLYMSKM